MSKIRRTGVSFETAVEQCLHASTHLSITRSPYLSADWTETDNIDSFLRLELKVLARIRTTFPNVKTYCSNIGMHMVSFETDIVPGFPSTVYVVFDQMEKEFYVDDIQGLDEISPETINQLNAASLYSKLWFNSNTGKLGASWNIPATFDVGNAPIIWRSLLSFINACREIKN